VSTITVVTAFVAGCGLSLAVAAALVAPEHRAAVAAGMAGPLVSACGTWFLIDRTLREQPAMLTQRLLRALLVKVVFFLSYVVVAVKGLELPVRPFAVSFATYFIVLHQTEAFLLRRRNARAFTA
jgi:hypothetical protein